MFRIFGALRIMMRRCIMVLFVIVFGAAVCNCACSNDPVDPVDTAPVILEQPASVAVEACSAATFSVVAQGTEPLSYQWYQNGVPLTGAKESSIQADTNPADNGASYSVKVTNSVGIAESEVAVLTVLPATPEDPEGKLIWKNSSGAMKVALSETAVAWTDIGYVYTASLPCATNARKLCMREGMGWTMGVLIEGDQILWTDMNLGQLWTVPIAGGPCRRLVDQGIGYRITDVAVAEGRAYLSAFGYGNNRIVSVPLDGGEVQAINVGIEGSRVFGNIETDGKFVYWIDAGTKQLNRMAVGSETVEIVVTDQSYVSEIVVAGDYLYWSRQTGTDEAPSSQILRIPLEGGEPEVLVSQSVNIWSVVIDGDRMFWNSSLPNTSEGRTIWTAATDGQRRRLRSHKDYLRCLWSRHRFYPCVLDCECYGRNGQRIDAETALKV